MSPPLILCLPSAFFSSILYFFGRTFWNSACGHCFTSSMSPLQSILIGVSSSLPNLKCSCKSHGLVVEGISKFHLTSLLVTPHSHLIHSLNILNTFFKFFSLVSLAVHSPDVFCLFGWLFGFCYLTGCSWFHFAWVVDVVVLYEYVYGPFFIYALLGYLFLYCGFYFNLYLYSYSFVSSLDLFPELQPYISSCLLDEIQCQ